MTDNKIQILWVEPTSTAVIRNSVQEQELSKFVPAACGEVWSFLRANAVSNTGRNVALYLDPAGTVEVGCEVSESVTGNGRVQHSQLPSGMVAHAVHFGPYQYLKHTHAAIRNWCRENGHQATGACWEIYGHWEESWNRNPSSIRTDVFHLLIDA